MMPQQDLLLMVRHFIYMEAISVHSSTVHNAYPAKTLYFTEQYTSSTGDFAGDLKWHLKNVDYWLYA